MLKDILAAIFRITWGLTPDAAAKELDAVASKRSGKLDWRHSIVDLLKLLDMDASLGARQILAKEMGRVGTFSGTADDNIWLHGEVMKAIGQREIDIPKA